MKIKFYRVEVSHKDKNTKIIWKLNGKIHCEHGPAIWYQDETYEFYLKDKWLTQKEWEKQTSRKWNLETKRSTAVHPESFYQDTNYTLDRLYYLFSGILTGVLFTLLILVLFR